MATSTGAVRPDAARGPSGPAASPKIDADTLAARLREIAAGAEAPIDALEPALRAILEQTGTAAGAVCLFDQRHEFLRLAAEAGLSDEGCRRLRIVRRGDVAGWDMPLHGLLNRRAYLIESAAQNRYVPPLVDATTPVRAVACLPLYAGATPVGSLVLVAVGMRTIAEREIHALEPPLRELGRMIEAVRRHTAAPNVATGASGPPDEVSRAATAARSAESPASLDAARSRSLSAALAVAQRERARLEAEIERLRAGTEADTRAEELTAEIDRLRARLAEAEAGAAHEHRVREELEAALERGASSDQVEMRHAVEAAHRAEASRAALAAENERLGAELERLRVGAPRGEDHATELAAEIDRLRARLAEAEAGAAHEHRVREELEAALERGASSGRSEVRDALDAVRRAEAGRAALAAENERLVAAIERLREGVPRDAAQAAELALEVDRLRARLAEAEAGAAHEHRAREELESALERGALHGREDLHQALEATRRAEDGRAAAIAETARLAAELDWARHEVERIEPLAAALTAARETEGRLTAELDAARAELAELDRGAAEREAGHNAEHRAEVERLERRLAESEAAAARERHLRETLEAASAHDLSARSDDVHRALETARLAEEARDAAVAAQAEGRAELVLASTEREEARASLERLREQLARAQEERRSIVAERDRVATELTESRAHEEESARRLAERDHELGRIRSDHAREIATAEERLEALGAEGAKLRAELAAAEVERDRALADMQGAAAARARLEESLEQALEEGRARERTLTAQLAEREQEAEQREATRVAEAAAASARIEALATEADGLRSTVAALETERDRLAAEAEGASAARARLEEALEGGLAEARAREQQIAGRLEEREDEIRRLEGERAAETAAATTRLDALTAEDEELRRTVAGLEAERNRLSAEAEGGAAARTRLEETLARTMEEARTREHTLQARIEECEREIEQLRRAQVEKEITASSDGIDLAAEGEEPMAADEPLAESEAVAPETPAPEAPPTSAAETPSESDVVVAVLDVDRGWDRITRPGKAIDTIVPDGTAAQALGQIRPINVIANLGAPRVLDTLIALRADGSTARLWGCVADATSGRALALGRVEPATRPLDPDAVLASLKGLASKGTRVVTIGDDVDAFVSLRQAFAREGMSVSMAWNAKQAADLIPLVRPAVVVVELDLPPGDVEGVLGKIAVLDPLPVTVFLPATKDRGRGLGGALADPAHRSLLVSIAEVIARATRAPRPR